MWRKQTKIATQAQNQAAGALREATSITNHWAQSICCSVSQVGIQAASQHITHWQDTVLRQTNTERASQPHQGPNPGKKSYCINLFWQAVIVHQALSG